MCYVQIVNMTWMKVIIEAIVVGIATVVMGYIVGFATSPLFKKDMNPLCKDWNKNHAMEINLFLIGFFLHLFAEFFKVNKWYCNNGNACLQ